VVEPLEDRPLLSTGGLLDLPAAPGVIAAAPSPLALPLGGGTPGPVGLNPAQIEQAYGFNTIAFQGGVRGDGTGQTIAIVDAYHDPNIQADLHAFDQTFHLLPDPSLTIADPDGVPQDSPTVGQGVPWARETALDVAWVHALAPGAAIVLVETPGGTASQVDQGLIDGVNYARNQQAVANRPAVSVVSMSWTETSLPNEDAVFTTPGGHPGVTFVAGTGDDGVQAGYPATSTNVLAVGGTEFTGQVDSSGDYPAGGETAWIGSSGGVDPAEPQPLAQQLAIGALGGRATPDVAFDAHTEVAVYDSYDDPGASWVQVFGTSIGAPAWSALVAIADQGRMLVGSGSLDGGTQMIPALYAIARAGQQSAAFQGRIGP
jgi:subtilase family serine protease